MIGLFLPLVVLLGMPACSPATADAGGSVSELPVPEVAAVDSVDLSRHFDGLEATFVLLDPQRERRVHHNPARARTRFLPASTFKIPNSLIALETGVVAGAEFTLGWDSIRNPREAWWPLQWTQPNTLRSAFQNSVVWYYQEVARRIGPKCMHAYMEQLQYGNGDLSAGIDQFWLSGGFGISPEEQLEFLHRFYTGSLGFSHRSTETVKEIMLLDEAADHRFSGKTGTARLPEGSMLAWLVGYVEREGEVYFYALNLEGERDRVWREWQSPKRVAVTRAILQELGVLPQRSAASAAPR
jgi:beta-lactamase class D